MNKKELVDAIAKQAGLSKVDSEKALNAFIDITEKAVKKGDSVSLVGFGTFTSIKKAARVGRNPQKPGETLKIPARVSPKFKPGKQFKDIVDKKKK